MIFLTGKYNLSFCYRIQDGKVNNSAVQYPKAAPTVLPLFYFRDFPTALL